MRYITAIISIFTFQLHAQIISTPGSTGGLDSRVTEAFTRMRNKISVNESTIENISGSPYYSEEFKKGSIVYFDSELKEQPLLRYNAFSDEIEMNANNSDNPDQALLKNSKIHCTIDGVTYKYLPIPKSDPQFEKAGYLEEVFKGNSYTLYVRKRKVYREGKKARTSLEQSFSPRFIDYTAWYYQIKSGGLIYFKPNKKNIRTIFKDQSKSLSNYLSKNKVDFKKKNDLKNLFSYLDNN